MMSAAHLFSPLLNQYFVETAIAAITAAGFLDIFVRALILQGVKFSTFFSFPETNSSQIE